MFILSAICLLPDLQLTVKNSNQPVLALCSLSLHRDSLFALGLLPPTQKSVNKNQWLSKINIISTS